MEMEENNMEEKIQDSSRNNIISQTAESVLYRLGFNPRNTGYWYLIDFITLRYEIIDERLYYNTCNIYRDIAKKHRKTWSAIEKAIHYTINSAIRDKHLTSYNKSYMTELLGINWKFPPEIISNSFVIENITNEVKSMID